MDIGTWQLVRNIQEEQNLDMAPAMALLIHKGYVIYRKEQIEQTAQLGQQ